MRLVRTDERVDFEDSGNRVVLKLLGGTLEDDDFEDVVRAIDLLLDMMVSQKFKTKFDVGAYRSKIGNVRDRFDDVVSKIRDTRSKS